MVNWGFLIKILWAFGFCNQFIQLVNQCISMSKFFVLIKGSPSSFFLTSRGVRQGDPLSLFLFILIDEALSKTIQWEVSFGRLKGLCPSSQSQVFSHQQFVRDTLLMGENFVA